MATVTASLAAASVIPQNNHTTNVIVGSYTGALSASASARLLMAKIPATASRVQITVNGNHGGGGAVGIMNFGLVSGTAGTNTASVSVFGTAVTSTIGVLMTYMSPAVDVSSRWNQTAGETFKYVCCSYVSTTVTTAFSLKWQITY